MTKDEFKNYSLAQANWWIAYANTKENKERTVFCGDNKLSEEELVNDALNTARQHLRNYSNICNGIPL